MRRFLPRAPSGVWILWALVSCLAAPGASADALSGASAGVSAGDGVPVVRRVLGPESVTAGPWLVLGAGEARFCLRFAPPLTESAISALPLTVAGVPTAASPSFRIVPDPRGREAAQIQAEWRLTAAAAWTTVVLGRPGDERRYAGPAQPAPGATVRALLVSALTYPTAEQLAAIEGRLGGPATCAIWLGDGDGRRLGSGGWESRLPVAVVADAASPALGDRLAAPGLRLGDLRLAAADQDADLPASLSDPAPWSVILLTRAPWDLRLGATATGPDRLRFPVQVAVRRQVPLIIAGGSAAGFLSEPLVVDERGRIQAKAGGIRYAVLPPGGEPLACLPRSVAVALDAPAVPVLVVDQGDLTLDLGDHDPRTWRWQRPTIEVEQAGPGWGFGDGAELAETWRAGIGSLSAGSASATVVDTAALVALPRDELARGGWDVLTLFRLARPADREALPGERQLARRLVSDPWFVGDEATLLARMPDWLQREAILRWMAASDGETGTWTEPLARSQDDHLLRAWLAQVERAPTAALLAPGVRRLELQATGEVPADPDPLFQNRLTAAVFDSPLLSPTPLRPIAAALQDKLAAVGYAPAKRFLERKGRFRPVEE